MNLTNTMISPNSPFICDLFRPLIRSMPLGRVAMLRFLGGAGSDGTSWKNKKQYRIFYDCLLQAYVWADMEDWSGRWHYYTGSYYDKKNQYLIINHLREGDIFIDVGANVGMHTILASRVVGLKGHVYSFEPQANLARIIQAQLTLNNIQNVDFHEVGLSDESTELPLRNQLPHHGTASFRLKQDQGKELFHVQVLRGEELLPDLSARRILIKIDVEGFEYKVIKGLGKILSQENVALSVEVTDEWLHEAGSSAEDLYSYLKDMGFEAYIMSINKFGKTRLEPAKTISEKQHDALFLKSTFASAHIIK